jgi:antitoxin (DNA-binding transcriptional repressor) of toxin-antitoxin stability system
MNTISLLDIQRDPLSLLQRLEAGETLLVTSGGRTVAELRPIEGSVATSRPMGLAKGDFVTPVDFDAPLPDELLGEFEGR